MSTVNKSDYPEVFFENDEMNPKDQIFFQEAFDHCLSENERVFLLRLKEKECGEYAPSADLLMSENDNSDSIYIVRYFFDEYRIGRHLGNIVSPHDIRVRCLVDALNADLYPVLGEHVSLLEWLRRINFKGVNYNGNYILNR